MWVVLQALVVFSVVASNSYWQWTPNTYLAGILAWVAALLVTVALNGLIEMIKYPDRFRTRVYDFWRWDK